MGSIVPIEKIRKKIEIIKELKDQSGKQFDPKIVEALVLILHKEENNKMLHVYIILISVIVGLIRNGKLSSLSQISITRMELIILACLIQGAIIFLRSKKIKFILDYSAYMVIFSYIVLLLAVWYNKKLKGMKDYRLGDNT